MEAGFLDRVELEGDSYQVQTELVDADSGRVRSVVFHNGQVVAVNDARLHGVDGGAIDPQAVHDLVRLHHDVVLEGFVRRTRGFAERAAAGVDRPMTPVFSPAASTAAPEAELELDIPPIPEDPALADSIEVRRMFAEFRARTSASEAGVSERVGHAAAALAWLHDQPRFGRARIDEQARVHLLLERTGEWEAAGRPSAAAAEIWTEVVVFCAYVAEVNNRADLLAFDRRLVRWALRALEVRGPSRSTLKPLQWLFGRDDEVDRLLGVEDEMPAKAWVQALSRVSAELGEA